MIKNIKTYYEYGSVFCGVEHATQNEQDIIYTTLLKKNKNGLDIANTLKEYTFDKALENLSSKQHISLVINNANVLTKQVESTDTDSLKIVHQAFPNINLSDFYYTIFTQNKYRFVSICRKTYIDEITHNYIKSGFFVINIALGNSVASVVSPFLETEDISTSNATIAYQNKEIISIKQEENLNSLSYNINGLSIANNYILSSSAALNTLLNTYNPISNISDLVCSLELNYKQSRFYNVFLKLGLAMILVILLINFFAFNNYFNDVKLLQQSSQINKVTKEKILKLNTNVNHSQKMVEDMLKSNSSKSSYYINTIIQGLPASILLSEINYQPILKRIKPGQQINIEKNYIVISGESNNSEAFSKWLSALEQINWIYRVDILSYQDYSKFNSKFNIKLQVINDK
jgi:Tfp pilus assembly protein PilN